MPRIFPFRSATWKDSTAIKQFFLYPSKIERKFFLNVESFSNLAKTYELWGVLQLLPLAPLVQHLKKISFGRNELKKNTPLFFARSRNNLDPNFNSTRARYARGARLTARVALACHPLLSYKKHFSRLVFSNLIFSNLISFFQMLEICFFFLFFSCISYYFLKKGSYSLILSLFFSFC